MNRPRLLNVVPSTNPEAPAMHTNRRALFGLIALPALPALAAIPSPAAAHLDADLLELERQRLIARGAYDRLAARADELDTQAKTAFPAQPDALRARPGDWFGIRGNLVDRSGHYSGQGLELLRAAVEPPQSALYPIHPRHAARVREILAAARAHDQAREAVYVASGARHASDLCDAACAVLGDLEDRILATPARTSEGLAIKARMVACVMGSEPDGTREDWAARALLADLAPVPASRTLYGGPARA